MYKIQNQILEKFGYPNSLIKEYENWFWLLRPEQITLGSSIIITKSYCERFSELTGNQFLELREVVNDVESSLKQSFNYEKINYLMLMMNDPTVHYHVIPRYSETKVFKNVDFFDRGWPGIPLFKPNPYENKFEMSELISIIKQNFS